ncbi:hypothetical protein SK571_21945 [Lentzea sp. BCCO 10_0798]|uniref:DUF3558 domain-containing protein n=1 Tax=Lentzea kristufekii TaxID=3095430 RepID=A0ABU4TUS5_9PSEU|nr:hypothetical protein [Lentzea sp. BCCO 10_0798]MDX8052059.1 hypothetical protein [Lentzea sp. BCCO 10_0798]
MAAVVLAAGGVTTGGLYRMAHRDGGVAQRNDTLPELCEIVSPTTLAKARTTNGDARYSVSTKIETSCVWDQTLGRDGAGMRTLVVNIGKPHNPELLFDSYLQTQTQGQASEVTTLDGVGDAAKSVLTAKRSDPRAVSGHVVRKGEHVIAVRYVGADPSLFTKEAKPDMTELQSMSRAVLDEVLGKL